MFNIDGLTLVIVMLAVAYVYIGYTIIKMQRKVRKND